METVTIDILNDKALRLLEDLEHLDLIRMHKAHLKDTKKQIAWSKYKGALTKQPLEEVEKQLNELRNDWE